MSNPIITFALRGTQVLFSVVVLGLSIGLIKGQKYPGAAIPATLGYAAFVGATSLLGAFIGLASNWVELLQGIIGAAIDGFVLVINIAGGIIIAYKLRGINCANKDLDYVHDKMRLNDLLSGGCGRTGGVYQCWYWDSLQPGKLNSRCQVSQADSVFMFLTVVILIATLTMTFLHLKR
ncbi:hypothetical protein K504DRAFT_455315 [Pleomassaria siparia CBS 279.74]|uniref:MARVEL domain-containing protein n=1 Tax=Pleomassaria siparia CBS 279.74 TaxID=1314801 RepID=A0A6G1K9X8_9PLEO|nr:hypothetical protein K504DRAFT_455315 [Pleomassaria siparia CBS 279.74]